MITYIGEVILHCCVIRSHRKWTRADMQNQRRYNESMPNHCVQDCDAENESVQQMKVPSFIRRFHLKLARIA